MAKHPKLLHEDGYTLVAVAVVAALLSFIIQAVFVKNQATIETAGMTVEKQKISYLAEGVTQIANKFAQDYLADDLTPTDAELNAYVSSKIAGFSIAPRTLSSLQLSLGTPVMDVPIPGGPFQGMDSMQVPLSIDVAVSDGAGEVHGTVLKDTTLAKITLFQFALFGDVPGAASYLAPGMPMDVRGRVHINGDFCLGNYGGAPTDLRLEKVTASGAIRNIRDPSCWAAPIPVANQTMFATDTAFSSFAMLNPGSGGGCVNCDGSGMDWRAYSLARWAENVLDSAHDIGPLRLPIRGTDVVQSGIRADNSAIANQGSLRFIVDPVHATDSASVREQKIAQKADIRIINGVWYLKNPANPSAWPGVPVWSDHPGRFVAQNEEGIEGTQAVGQEDIRQRWQGTPNQWPAGDTPRRFSYYEYDAGPNTIRDDVTGTISYGTLFRSNPGSPAWSPGQWAMAASTNLCAPTRSCTNCSNTDPLNALLLGSITCNAGVQPGIPDFLLNGTRSGFRDGHVFTTSAGAPADRDNRSRIFPLNFDIASFQAALSSGAPGELGSFFGAGAYMNRPFNGVVYITNTWAGAQAGLGGGFPADFPFQGGVNDVNQAGLTSTAQQRALPFPLCSADSASVAGGVAGQSYSGPQNRFRVPDCAKYAAGYAGADRIDSRPNAIRIHNGRTIDQTLLSRGLTIATNLPVYVLGDMNTNSDVSSAAASPWVPMLVAADQVTLLSNNWDDRNSRWDQALDAVPNGRLASDTTYHLSILTGGVTTTPTAWSGGFENLPRYIERWNGIMGLRTARIRGSLVLGFSSVYFRHRVGPSVPAATFGDVTYTPPQRDFGYDPHLKRFSNQPPGAPVFDIYAVQRWASR